MGWVSNAAKVQVTTDSNLISYCLLYMDFLVKKLTHDKFQYHTRVKCKLCLQSMGRHHSHGDKESESYSHCHHAFEQGSHAPPTHETNFYSYYPKLCARHRVPSVCNSEALAIRGHSRNSSTSQVAGVKDKTSSIDRHELKNTSSRFYRRKRRNMSSRNLATSTRATFNSKQRYADERQDSFENDCSAIASLQHNFSNFIPESTPQISNKVYFHLGDVDETSVADDDDGLMDTPATSSLETEQQLINFIKTANLTDTEKLSNAPKCSMSVLSSASSATLAAAASSSLLSAMSHEAQSSAFMFANRSHSSSSSNDARSHADMDMDETNESSFKADTTCGEDDDLEDESLSKSDSVALGCANSVDMTQLSWDSYWDGLESVVLGHTNNASIK